MVQSCPPMVPVEELLAEELSFEKPSLTCGNTKASLLSRKRPLSLIVQVNFITSTTICAVDGTCCETSAIDSTDSCAELPAKELPVEKLRNCQLRN